MRTNILLLEDDVQTAKVYQQLLEGLGYAVLVAKNGQKALELIQDEAISIGLAILDMEILGRGSEEHHLNEPVPLRRGLAVAKKLREWRGDVPIIIATGYGPDAERIMGESELKHYVIYEKETIHNHPEILNNSIELAVQNYESNKSSNEETISSKILVSQEREFIFTFNVREADREADDLTFLRTLVKRSEVCYLLSIGGGELSVCLQNGLNFRVGLGPQVFEEQYKKLLKVYDEDDFLIAGQSDGYAIWINPDNVYRFNKKTAYFLFDGMLRVVQAVDGPQGEIYPIPAGGSQQNVVDYLHSIPISNSAFLALDQLFPVFRTRI